MFEIKTYKLNRAEAKQDSQSNGWLLKWNFKDAGKWVWVKTPGFMFNWNGESYAEVIASAVAKDLKIHKFVTYRPCIVELDNTNILCCISDEFLRHDSEFDISFAKLMEQGILDSMYTYYFVDGHKKFINDCLRILDIDMSEQLDEIIVFDSLILNRDRTFRNFGIIANNYGGPVRKAPIFDSGSSFGLDMYFVTSEFCEEEKYSFGYHAKPFDSEYEKQLKLVKNFDKYRGVQLVHTYKTLEFIANNFSDKSNIYNVVNPIPMETIRYIKEILRAGISRLNKV